MSALCGAHEKVHGYLQDRSQHNGRPRRKTRILYEEGAISKATQRRGAERMGERERKVERKDDGERKKREKKIFSLLLHHSETFRIFENLFLNNFSWERGGEGGGAEEKGNFCET